MTQIKKAASWPPFIVWGFEESPKESLRTNPYRNISFEHYHLLNHPLLSRPQPHKAFAPPSPEGVRRGGKDGATSI